DDRAEAALLVSEFVAPQPLAVVMAAQPRHHVHDAVRYRPQKARGVAATRADQPLAPHRADGRHRGDSLGHRAVDAAVEQAERLLEVLPDLEANVRGIGCQLEPFEAEEAFEGALDWKEREREIVGLPRALGTRRRDGGHAPGGYPLPTTTDFVSVQWS